MRRFRLSMVNGLTLLLLSYGAVYLHLLQYRCTLQTDECEVQFAETCCNQYFSPVSKMLNTTVKIIGQVDYKPGNAALNEVKKAIRRSMMNNPSFEYVILSRSVATLKSFQHSKVSNLDLWHCSSINYGSPFLIGSLYEGIKIATSIDDIFPPWNYNCSLIDQQEQTIYALSRADIDSQGDIIKDCSQYKNVGSFDAFIFQNISLSALKQMMFPRFYWGAENVAAYALQLSGATLRSACPYYYPMHVDHLRSEGRIRINHGENSVAFIQNGNEACFS